MKKITFTIILVAAQAVFSQQGTTSKYNDLIIGLWNDYIIQVDDKNIEGMFNYFKLPLLLHFNTDDEHNISALATGATGLFTTTSSADHNLIVNDRVMFVLTSGSMPSFTDAALPPSNEAALSATRMYYVQSVPSDSTFTIAETKDGTKLTFDTSNTNLLFVKVHLADVVKDAPVPVGGALKVIAGQKLVLESLHANVNDKIYAYASAANACDVIASVLEDVS